MIPLAFTFDDVLLVPQKSSVLPRETDVSTFLTRRIKIGIPIVSAPMDTVTEAKMAVALGKVGGIGIIHKNMTLDEQVQDVKHAKAKGVKVGAAISVGDEQFARALKLVEAGVDVLVVDTAHGHSEGVIRMVRRIKGERRFAKVDVIAGNVVTAAGALDLIKAGADAVKVGVGPGAICTTRIVTGVGVPQITAIQEAVKGVHKSLKSNIPVIADGGITNSGDIAKALAAGANAVMLGSLLAGTDESPGKAEDIDGEKYKVYRGMGSLQAMEEGSKDRYSQHKVELKKLVPEGVVGRVPYRGAVAEHLYQLVGGLRSSMGYLGARTIPELQKKARFIQITDGGRKESHPHSVSKIENTVNYTHAD